MPGVVMTPALTTLHLRRFQSRRQRRADPGARLARVLADDYARVLVAGRQPLAQGASNGHHCLLVERILAGHAPNAICAE